MRAAARGLFPALAATGCGETAAPPLDNAVAVCPSGAVADLSGGCLPVGIQGCAEIFLGDDGLCHPSIAACPQGTIPRLDEGCVPVGIPERRCAEVFRGDDGLCRPSTARCADQPGTFAVPSEGCVPIDGMEGCGQGAFGDIPDTPGTIHVAPSAAPGGDGTRNAPVRTLGEGMALVEDGGHIALADGLYDEGVVVLKEVEIIGRCPSRVRLRGTTNDTGEPAVVLVPGTRHVALRRLEIGGAGAGIVATDGAEVEVEQVHVREASATGVVALGAGTRLALSRSLVEQTRPLANVGDGQGAAALGRAQLTISSSALLLNRGQGVLSIGAEVTITSTLIEGTQEHGQLDGFGALSTGGGTVTLRESAVVGNRAAGAGARDAGSELVATENLFSEHTAPRSSQETGLGMFVAPGTRATLAGNAVVDNETYGIFVAGPGTSLTSTGDLIASTRPKPLDGTSGVGVVVSDGAEVSMTSSAVVGNRSTGVSVQAATSLLSATGLLVEGTLPEERDRILGMGLLARGGASLRVAGSAVIGSRFAGLLADHAESIELRSSLVEATSSRESDGRFGRGIAVQYSAAFLLDTSLVTSNREHGLGLLSVGQVALSRSLVQRTLPQESDGEGGMGVVCDACDAAVSDTVIRDNRTTGMILSNATSLDASRVWVDRVEAGRLTLISPEETYEDIGDGILAMSGSSISLSDSRVEGAVRAGLLFDSITGLVRGTRSVRNGYGVVRQGSPQPELGEGNTFEGNALADIVQGGNLVVPDEPPEIP